MSAGTLTGNSVKEMAPRKYSAADLASSTAAAVLALTIAATVWLYCDGANRVEQMSGTLSVQKINAGVAGLLAGMLGVFIGWNHVTQARVKRLRNEVNELQAAHARAEGETRRAQEERAKLKQELNALSANIEKTVQERVNRMASAHEQLEKQLRDRQRAERLMEMQAKELVRSKDVLELHVQNRSLEIQKM